ncbi:MAG: GNAT family N-acetyltransferase [Microlunatus sp.]
MSVLATQSLIEKGEVRLIRVDPGDRAAVATAVELLNAAQRVDDPSERPQIPELVARWMEFGWDLEPDERYLCFPAGSQEPVAVFDQLFPRRDNRHLAWGNVVVDPAHRRRGYGTALVTELLRRAAEAGRTTVWLDAGEEDLGARTFIEGMGFRYASHDARRKQVLAEVDLDAVDRLHAQAAEAAEDYVLERLMPPLPDEVLEQLVEVTAAINDAPMGDLTFEDEVFDLARLKDQETARVGRGDRIYRIVARHRRTGVIGGHTVVGLNPLDPTHAHQGDTAVHRDHRGHRLGMLLKIEMMRWLAETEPQITEITTWNHADNRYMIDVNEAIGYRLSRVFATYELSLPTQS